MPGAPTVVRGAGDVASHLRADGNNLVALPEDLGLMAAFTGSQGAPARRAPSDVVGAVVGPARHLRAADRLLPREVPVACDAPAAPTRALALALTDTFGRVAVETYSELAARYHVWLSLDKRRFTVSYHIATEISDEYGCDSTMK